MLQPDVKNRAFNVILHKKDCDFWEFQLYLSYFIKKKIGHQIINILTYLCILFQLLGVWSNCIKSL